MGMIEGSPVIVKDDDGRNKYAHAYVCVVRGVRDAGDNQQAQMKRDYPMIMTNNSKIIADMERWKNGDIVHVKGILAAKEIKKGSYCTHCNEKNLNMGTLVYVAPIYAKAMAHYDSKDECIEYLAEHREVSNQAFVFGKLCRQPKPTKTKSGLTLTRYQIALNRKFHIKEDPPEVRSDYPWVSSYGENALRDKQYLQVGSEIFLDGCLHARSVMRHAECGACHKEYNWKDNILEIVPYDVEYLNFFKTSEELAEEEREKRREVDKKIFG